MLTIDSKFEKSNLKLGKNPQKLVFIVTFIWGSEIIWQVVRNLDAQITCLFREYSYTLFNGEKLNTKQNVTCPRIFYDRTKNKTQTTSLLNTCTNSTDYMKDNNINMIKYFSILIGEDQNSQSFRKPSSGQVYHWLPCYIFLTIVWSKKMHVIISVLQRMIAHQTCSTNYCTISSLDKESKPGGWRNRLESDFS